MRNVRLALVICQWSQSCVDVVMIQRQQKVVETFKTILNPLKCYHLCNATSALSFCFNGNNVKVKITVQAIW